MDYKQALKEAKEAALTNPELKIIGYYVFTGGLNSLAFYKKPCWLHRTLMKLLLGLKWQDRE